MQRRMRWRLLVLVFVAPAASGWNDTGHMVAALIAYDRMPSSVSAAMGRCCTRTRAFRRTSCRGCRKSLRNVAAAEQDRWYFAYRLDLAGRCASVRQRARRIGTRRAGRALQPRQLALHQSTDLSAALGPPADRCSGATDEPFGRTGRCAPERRAGDRVADAELVRVFGCGACARALRGLPIWPPTYTSRCTPPLYMRFRCSSGRIAVTAAATTFW